MGSGASAEQKAKFEKASKEEIEAALTGEGKLSDEEIKLLKEAAFAAKAARPEKCSECSTAFAPDDAIFSQGSGEAFLCRDCAEKKNAEQPKACSKCQKAFEQGDKVYGSGSEGFLCQACAEASRPKCRACGKAFEGGTVAKLGGDLFHQECIKCICCAKAIEGSVAFSPHGLMCSACKEIVSAQMHQMKELLEAGDATGAAKVGEELKAKGLKGPPVPKCAHCNEFFVGECDETAKGVICAKCGDNVAAEVEKMRELFEAGDPMGAALIGKKLKEMGVDPPSIESLKHQKASLLRSAKHEQEKHDGKSTAPDKSTPPDKSIPQDVTKAANKFDTTCCCKCSVELKAGQKAYKASGSGDEVLCETCFAASRPACAVCGKPASGSVAQLGGKFYHASCLTCSLCDKHIDGQCWETSKGPACLKCREEIEADAEQLKTLIEKGDTKGASELSEKLKARGLGEIDKAFGSS